MEPHPEAAMILFATYIPIPPTTVRQPRSQGWYRSHIVRMLCGGRILFPRSKTWKLTQDELRANKKEESQRANAIAILHTARDKRAGVDISEQQKLRVFHYKLTRRNMRIVGLACDVWMMQRSRHLRRQASHLMRRFSPTFDYIQPQP